MSIAIPKKTGLVLGFVAGCAGTALIIRRWFGRDRDDHAPAAAFAGPGAHTASPVHVRDAGPENIRDESGANWDGLDQASDESFPSSDPPSGNNFRTPEPIDYSSEPEGKNPSRPH